MDVKFTGAIHLADKYVRKKAYPCLIPGCNRNAIRGHSVPRASLVEAIARNGKIFSLAQSFAAHLNRTSRDAPMKITEVGVNAGELSVGFAQNTILNCFCRLSLPMIRKGKGLCGLCICGP